ncbi:MAG: NAD-binding protein [Spirochaetales bacterium]|nr:NAD-binding protein [Spirochaetales bacterium]
MWNKIRRFISGFISSRATILIFFLLAFFSVTGMLVLFFEFKENTQFTDFIDGFWWAIITFSTTGYGDKVPVTLGGRIIAILAIFLGIGAMTFLSGTLASIFVEQSNKIRRGFMDYGKKKNHYVICGWKDNIMDILKEILRLNGEIDSKDLVIVSNVDFEKIESIKKEKELSSVGYVKGDYYSDITLKQANVASARKVVILADRLESATPEEVDSKTVMAVLTVRSLSKDVYICAELLDEKYEPYMKQAMCDEIIRIRDYSRMIVANSSATNGISQIIYSLMSPERGTSKLSTCIIPPDFVNKTYSDFKVHVNQNGEQVLLGILENTGSPNKMKVDALREAQKTSDVSRLVLNLKAVKELKANNPVFLPHDTYVIRHNCMGIILEK